MNTYNYFMQINWSHVISVLWLPICIQLSALFIGLAINRLVNRYLHSVAKSADGIQYIFIKAIKGLPVSWCSGIGLYWTVTVIDDMPAGLSNLLTKLLLGIILFTITRCIARILVGIVDVHTNNNENLSRTSLLNNVISIFIYGLGTLVILQSYGISITPILTALGVGGMAVALALKDTLSNIFAGIYLILSRQIRLGDYIRMSSGDEGRVTDITWRFTTIQSVTNNVIIVPNQQISSAILTNYNMPKPEISISIPVGVSYDSDLEEVERITLEVANEVMDRIEHKIEVDPVVRFHTFADSSINFNVIMRSSQFANQYVLKHEFIKALTKRYREEGIEIPFPIRTLVNK